MQQTAVLYVAPPGETAEAVGSALEAAAPELSVSHAGSPTEACALFDPDAVDCLLVDWLPSGDSPSVVAAARSATPAVPVVWFTDNPPDSVVDSFDEHTDYVYKQEPAEQAGLLAQRIRSIVTAVDSLSADVADSVPADSVDTADSSTDQSGEAVAEALSEAIVGCSDAAHDLLSARSTEEIAEIGVKTAASVLGFEDAIVLSYDDELNVFHPLAYSPSAEAHLPVPLPISASDSSIAGRAFFDSELVVTENVSELPEAYYPETAHRRAMFVPLNEHGVLFVGDTDIGTTTEQTRTVAELLGATLAAAFSRLSAERRSEAHRQTLAERTAELETLTHTNAVVEALVDRLFDASTREEIEETVCAVLTGFDRYRFAWIGAADSRTDTVVSRVAAGPDGGYLDWLADRVSEVGCESVDEPTCRAFTTASPVSVDRISRDWQTAPWRKEALSRGYQSVLSVPLTHNEITYGVLSVYADAPATFDAYTETILTEFGRIIAYAIASTETRRGLLTDQRTDVEVEIDDSDDVLHRLSTRLDAPVDFEGFVPQREDDSLLYVSITGVPTTAVESVTTDTRGIERVRVVADHDGTALFELTVSGPVLAATLVDCGAIPTEIATVGTNQRVVVTLTQPTDVRTFIDRLQAVYPSTTVVSRQDADRGVQTLETFRMELLDRLTQRQAETLRAAYFARYFDSPRGSTGTEVGQSLGISQPTFNYHLRAALKTILTLLFDDAREATLDE